MITFNKNYFILAILLFITEVLIALYIRDAFVRPYLGDVLVVILLYCFIKSFLNLPDFAVAISVLIFAFSIELLQYVNMVEILGLQKSSLARAVLGTSFSWLDLLAYTAGIVIVLDVEHPLLKKNLVRF
jgi:Protein of unknown function (DUF2809)